MSFFSNFSKQLQSSLEEGIKGAQKLSNDFTPIAKRTARLVQEKFGSVEDISELPEEYILLEKKVDALRTAYRKLLAITETYGIESYDYPPNIKESVSDLSKTITEKFQSLQKASNTVEAEKVLKLQTDHAILPKTLSYEISKAAKFSYDTLTSFGEENSLSQILLKFSESQSRIGSKRLEQDKLITNEFNQKLQEALAHNFQETSSNRKKVEAARLNFDTLRYEVKINPEKQAILEGKLENAEDELVNATTVAVQSMKKLIEPAESVNLIILFNKIQLDFHKSVATELEFLIKDLEAIPIEEEEEEEDDDDDNDNDNDASAAEAKE